MRVLVACEYSGTVRDAFIQRGHDAISCDLLPTERPGPHYQGNIVSLLWDTANYGPFDLMIAHPPCTFLSCSGIHWNSRTAGRADDTEDALAFVSYLLGLPIPRIALENPMGVISTKIRKPDQIIQPYEYGHNDKKTTCLWLKGLPS